MYARIVRIGFFLLGALIGAVSHAADVSVAVAANFALPAKKIAEAFQRDTGHTARLALGSTGRFYAQITHGAPFEVLLAADDETPARLAREGLTAPCTRFTYAVGRLVLWSAQAGFVDAQGAVLKNGSFERLAVADPKLAPYGAAAVEAMTNLGAQGRLAPKLVQGENIAQTYQFVASKNAQLGFVALSQVVVDGRLTGGSAWVVPQDLHKPIFQAAVVLKRGQGQPAAIAFFNYLKGQKAQDIIRSYGYDLCGHGNGGTNAAACRAGS